jgi:putative transposase
VPQRWWGAYYSEGGLDKLLVSRVDERGRQEFVTENAWEELEEAMKEGRIATYARARNFLGERGFEYAGADGVGGLFRRRKAKPKTGRPRHEKADEREQEAFEKGSPRRPSPRRARSATAPESRRRSWGLRRGALRFDQLAPQALLPRRLSPAVRGVRRASYEWTYLYAAVDPTSGESFSLYPPGMDSLCFRTFLERLGEAYADHDLVVVLDGAPSRTSKEIELPENVSLLGLPSYSPELNPVER